jgi:hypothetical protein
MKSVNKNECIYYSVPAWITKYWADDKGHVKFIMKDFDDKSDESDVDYLFQESVEIYDGPKDTDDFDPFLSPVIEKALTALAEGDCTNLNRKNISIYIYASCQYNANFRSIGRCRNVMRDNSGLIKEYARKGKLDYILMLLLTCLRHTDEMDTAIKEAVENVPLYLDLTPLLVSAPDDSAFVLPDCPVLFFNFLNPTRKVESLNLEDYYGTVFLLPLSPRYALCLYDSYTYRIMKEGDRAVFSDDDMLLINSLLVRRSSTVAYTETEKFPASLISELREREIPEEKDRELSVFAVRNRAIPKMHDLRDFTNEMRSFDDIEHYSENYGSLSERDNAIRLAYAYQILKESKSV